MPSRQCSASSAHLCSALLLFCLNRELLSHPLFKGEEKALSKEVSVIQEAHGYLRWGSGFKGQIQPWIQHGILCLVSRIQYIGRRHQKRVEALGMIQGHSFWIPTSTGDSVAWSLYWHRCQVPCPGTTNKV